mgnify:CR=1 FL=1
MQFPIDQVELVPVTTGLNSHLEKQNFIDVFFLTAGFQQ